MLCLDASAAPDMVARAAMVVALMKNPFYGEAERQRFCHAKDEVISLDSSPVV
jgi:hypothetical protein